MKNRNIVIRALLRVGFVTETWEGKIRWPFHIAPRWLWAATLRHPGLAAMHGWVYLFRNRPGFIKWTEGRWLPRRWGFGIAGLIEFGDRG